MTTTEETTGWVSKLTKNSAWVRLNYTLNKFTEDELIATARLFVKAELTRHGKLDEAFTAEHDWVLNRMKYAVPATREGRNTVLVYLTKLK
jgi:hypothetical protein